MSDDPPEARLDDRRRRLESFLDERDLAAVWFARPNSFAWLTGGDNVVDGDADVGVAAAGYVRPDEGGDGTFRAVTNNVEADRLREEELPDGVEVVADPWYEGSLAEAVAARSPTPAAADGDVSGRASIDAGSLRMPLPEVDVAEYRALGRQTAAAVERVARELEPGDTEGEVAAALRVALATREIDAPVVLVGGSDRATRYRHYTPTSAELGDYALLSVTAERNGLYASATRTVAFDPPEWLEERHGKAARVEASALDATREAAIEGGTAGDVFARIREAYDAVGHPDEWRRHHQGGAAGYAGREWIATPDREDPVAAPMAYAWNPTIRGAKSEDTVLVTEDGFEVLTATGSWPTREVEAVGSDASIDRHDLLRTE